MTIWDDIIIVIFFFYGLAFYSLGLALLVESGRISELGFARSMRLLAGFGLLHGLHEWIDMFERGLDLYYSLAIPQSVHWLKLAVLTTSFLALLAFGEQLLARERKIERLTWRVTGTALALFTLVSIGVKLTYQLDEFAWSQATDVLARYIIGVPGAVLACWALWQQRTSFRAQGMGRFVTDLSWSALALALYGVVGQIFVTKTQIFPSSIINSELFLSLTGFPIQLFRASMATVVAFALIRVLRSLEVENQLRLTEIKRTKIETERQSAEELARLNEELRQANIEANRLIGEIQRRDTLRGELLQRITAAQEAERKRIARELHDDTGQTLTGVALGLRGLVKQVTKNPQWAQDRLTDLEQMATAALGELRLLINDLRPPQLDDMGLAAALRFMVQRFKTSEMVEAELEIIGTPYPMPSEVETTLFRIAQEGLTNVIKHANASHVQVVLDFTTGPSLMVRDDGVGFDPSIVLGTDATRTAWGLLGIQERASLIDAIVTMDSEAGWGTTLTVRLQESKKLELVHDHPSADN